MGETLYWIRIIILWLYSMFLFLLNMIVNFDKVLGGAFILVGLIMLFTGNYALAAFLIPAGLVVVFVLGKLKGFILEKIEKLQQKRNNN